MNTLNALRGVLRRVTGSSLLKLPWPNSRPPAALQGSSAEAARRTVPLPSILAPGAPTPGKDGACRSDA